MNNKRLDYIDGLKGFFAIIVFLHHFILAFAPKIKQWGGVLWTTLRLLYDGTFGVSIFLTLTGYLLTIGYLKETDIFKIQERAIKRYFRFSLPILGCTFLSFFCMKLNLYFNDEAGILLNNNWLLNMNNFDCSFLHALKVGMITPLYYPNPNSQSYLAVLWTMPYTFLGTYLVLATTIFLREIKNRWIVYVIICIFFQKNRFLSVFFGMIIADVQVNFKTLKNIHIKNKNIIGILFFILGWYLEVNIASIQNILQNNLSLSSNFCMAINSILIIAGVMLSGYLKYIFENKIILGLGKISFSIYMIHNITLLTLACWIYIININSLSRINTLIITFSVYIVVTIMLSYFYEKYIVKICNKISNILCKKLFNI